jgi:cytochrome c-type biogenesis protein CcmH
MNRFLIVFMLCLSVWISPASAVQPDEILADPKLEERARELSVQLRCMVCQNQSIDDSDAPLARDLRILVRERLQAGDSNDEIIEFLVERYGEFVLLKPRFTEQTLILWIAPFIVLILGVFLMFLMLKKRKKAMQSSSVALSSQEQQRVEELVKKL